MQVNMVINSELKIGVDCFYLSISSLLEHYNALSLSLSYTTYDFIYNENLFADITYIPSKDGGEFEDGLFIVGNISSSLERDFYQHLINQTSKYNIFEFKDIEINQFKDPKKISDSYLSKGLPIIIKTDNYYLHDEINYPSKGLIQHHSNRHVSALFDFDLENNKAYIADKLFDFVGNVSLDSYYKAINSEFLPIKGGQFLKIKEMSQMSELERARILLKDFRDELNIDSVILNGAKYYKNSHGMSRLISNFEEHLNEFKVAHKTKAPQFLSILFQSMRLSKVSFMNVLSYINSINHSMKADKIIYLINEVKKLWFVFNALCDKCLLKKQDIMIYKERLQSVLEQIYEKEKLILELLSSYDIK